MKKLPKAAAILLSVLLAFSMSAVPAAATSDDFEDYLYNEWKDTVESDYMEMHTSVYDWRSMGLTKPKVTLGDLDFDEAVASCQEALEKLREFDPDELDDTERHDYLAYEYYLECMIDMYSYPEFQFMFQPYNGTLTNIIDNFADFPFYEKQDVEDYLTLVAELPSVIDMMMEFTADQAENGYFLDDLGYTDEMYELNEAIEKGEKNPLIINFEDNIDKFEGITEAERNEYKQRNRDIVLESILPKFGDIRYFLYQYKDTRSVPTGALAEYTPDGGKADGLKYYESLVKFTSSSDDSLEEIFAYLEKALCELMDYYDFVLENDPEYNGAAEIEGMESLDDVLTYLQDNMEGFPQGPDVNYTPSYLPPGSNDFAMAYYVPAPVDRISQNIIRVNPDNIGDINTLYYTLAHEGFPGHLYQFTWYQASEGFKPLRQDTFFMGYMEGWANYAEYPMLLMSGLDETSADDIYLNEIISFVLYSACDIAVNGLGYDEDQLAEWLVEIGSFENYAKELYLISVEMPGSYIPYGYGVCKFLELRERCHQALGNDFNDVEFHEVMLKYGPRQFELVEEDLKDYVESKGKSLPDDFTFFGSSYPKKSIFDEYPIIKYLAGVAVVIAAGIIVIIINKKRRKMEEEITDSLTE